jgi:hypothetical protein
MYERFLSWLAENMQPCYFRQLSGHDCPGCGFQRGLLLLLQGDLSASISMYPALLLMIFMFLFLIAHLIFRFKHGGTILLYTFIVVVSVSSGFALLKFIIA